MIKISWPIVAIIGMVLAFLVGIFWLIPSNMPEARTALLGLITGAVGTIQVWFVARVQDQQRSTDRKVDQVVKQTNGHMTTLIAAKTQPAEGDVSRETEHP